MRKAPMPPDPATRRGTVVVVILALALVFLCVVLAIGVQRVIAERPDLTSQVRSDGVGGQPPDR